VAVGNERSHAAAPGQHQSVAVVAFGVLIAACQRNVTGKAQGVGLLAPSPQTTAGGKALGRGLPPRRSALAR
jgi:hypothetical protein